MLGILRNLRISRVATNISNSVFSTAKASNPAASTTTLPQESTTKQNDEIEKILYEEKTEKDKLFSKLEIELKGIDPAVLKSYSWFATTAADHLGIEVGKCWAERKPFHDRMVLLKSVHIYKKHRVQYEIRTYYRYMNFHKLTGSTLDTFLAYIELNLPEGVALKATKIEIQELPEHLREPPSIQQSPSDT